MVCSKCNRYIGLLPKPKINDDNLRKRCGYEDSYTEPIPIKSEMKKDKNN